MTIIALPLLLALAASQPDQAAAQAATTLTLAQNEAPAAAQLQPAPSALDAAQPSAAAPAPAQVTPTQQTAPAPRPSNLDDSNVAPDGPLRDSDRSYQNKVLGNFNASQGRQGPYDGRWTVSGSAGDMFILQLTDPGEGGKIEGAWRDVRRVGGGRSGLIDSITRDGDAVIVNFVEQSGGQPVEVRLRSPQPGGFLGEASTPEGGRQSIVMHRAASVEQQAALAPRVYQPPPPRASAESSRPAPKSAKAKKGRHSAAQRHGRATAKSHSPKKQHSASKSSSKGKKAAVSSSKKKSSTSSKAKSSGTKKSTTAKKSSSKKKTTK